MDRQIRFNEEVLQKIANLNSHFEKLNNILEDIYIYIYILDEDGIEFKAKNARSELGQIGKVINEILINWTIGSNIPISNIFFIFICDLK